MPGRQNRADELDALTHPKGGLLAWALLPGLGCITLHDATRFYLLPFPLARILGPYLRTVHARLPSRRGLLRVVGQLTFEEGSASENERHRRPQ